MHQFKYRAIDSNGKNVNGFLDAESQDKAVSALQLRGLLVLNVEIYGGDAYPTFVSWFQRTPINATEIAYFTLQLAILVDAGQPLERALSSLSRQPSKHEARLLLERIRDRVKNGQTLSTAMTLEGGQFTPLYLSLIRAGEASGELGQTLKKLAHYLERSQRIKGEVGNALIYPSFLLIGVLGSLVLLLAYVVPQFVPIFKDLGVPIPLITEAILGLGQFLSNYGLYLIVVVVVTLLIFSKCISSPTGRLVWDRSVLHWWVVGPLILRLETARLSHTLGTLLSQGVPLIASVRIALQVCKNQLFRQSVEQAIDKVKGGSRLSAALEENNILPEMAIQMIQIGEESGALGTMLLKVASVYEEEAKRSIDRLLAALIPSLTLIMAALVALIMLAIMLPLVSLTSNI